jgi:hypothetical protein
MNERLKSTKENLKKIERFCKGRPMPDKLELEIFLRENELESLKDYSFRLLEIQQMRGAILHNLKINKSRL